MDWNIPLAFAGIIIGVVGSYLFYRLSLPIRKPSWSIKSNTVIQDNAAKISGVTVLYGKEKVDTLTISKILFWNGGITTIRLEDIAEANPIKIAATNGVKLLDVKVISCNNPSSKFNAQLQRNKKSALITFNYLDKNDGAVIQIIHTGKSSTSLNITGDIKGGKSPKIKSNTPRFGLSYLIGIVFLMLFWFVILFIVVFVLAMIFRLTTVINIPEWLRLMIAVLTMMASIFPTVKIMPHIDAWLVGLPKEFKDF